MFKTCKQYLIRVYIIIAFIYSDFVITEICKSTIKTLSVTCNKFRPLHEWEMYFLHSIQPLKRRIFFFLLDKHYRRYILQIYRSGKEKCFMTTYRSISILYYLIKKCWKIFRMTASYSKLFNFICCHILC